MEEMEYQVNEDGMNSWSWVTSSSRRELLDIGSTVIGYLHSAKMIDGLTVSILLFLPQSNGISITCLIMFHCNPYYHPFRYFHILYLVYIPSTHEENQEEQDPARDDYSAQIYSVTRRWRHLRHFWENVGNSHSSLIALQLW